MKFKIYTKFLRFFYHPKKSKTDNFITNGFECCVICGKQTKIPATRNVNLREYYEKGCGQLCISCYQNLRNVNSKENLPLSKEQLSILIEQSRIKVKKQ